MISHKYKCVYIHIPKTAGSSVEKKLGLFQRIYNGAQDHRSVKDLLDAQRTGKISEQTLSEYFMFTIVRNPWERVYSWYKNVMIDPAHGLKNCDFKTFLDISNNEINWALKPQLYWITDYDNQVVMDRIVKYENLKAEMPVVLNMLGFRDTSLPHINKNGRGNDFWKSSREVYDSYSIDLVRERYSEEIELFQYSF